MRRLASLLAASRRKACETSPICCALPFVYCSVRDHSQRLSRIFGSVFCKDCRKPQAPYSSDSSVVLRGTSIATEHAGCACASNMAPASIIQISRSVSSGLRLVSARSFTFSAVGFAQAVPECLHRCLLALLARLVASFMPNRRSEEGRANHSAFS